MSENIYQLYLANPATTMQDTDLLYLGRYPYASGDDFAIQFSDFQSSLVTPIQVQQSFFNASAATGVNNAFQVVLDPPVTSLTDGLLIIMSSETLQNTTTTPTLKVNALSPVNITIANGTIAPFDISPNGEYIFVYIGASNVFELINPTISTADTFFTQANTYNTATDSGAANAYAVTLSPAHIGSYTTGFPVYMIVGNTNTGASTLTVNGTTANIYLNTGAAIPANALVQNRLAYFIYSSQLSGWVLMNPSAGSGFVELAPTANQTITGGFYLKANTFVPGYSTTVTAIGTTVLTAASTQLQFFTGTQVQNVQMPVTSTLTLGYQFTIVNRSLTNLTIKASGGATITTLSTLQQCVLTCILTTGATAASWSFTSAALAGGISRVFTDSGSVTGTSIVICTNFDTNFPNNAGSSVRFAADTTFSPQAVVLGLTDANGNTILGKSSGNASITGTNNTILGYLNSASLTSGNQNCLIGYLTGVNITTGDNNVVVGSSAYDGTSGTYNLLLGTSAGYKYTSNESHNVLLNSYGILGESNVLRIGTGTGTSAQNLNSAYICGIYSQNPSTGTSPQLALVDNTNMVTVISSGTIGDVLISNGSSDAPSFESGVFVQLNPAADQTISNYSLSLTAGNFVAPGGRFESGNYTLGGYPGSILLYPSTALSGDLYIFATASSGDYEGGLTNAGLTDNRQWYLPDESGILLTDAFAVVTNPTSNQTINGVYSLILDQGSYYANNGYFYAPLGVFFSGSSSGGVSGAFVAYSNTANLGLLALTATDSAGNFDGIVTNASLSANQTWTLPDATGTFLISGQDAYITNIIDVNGNNVLGFNGNASAVNYLRIDNNPTGIPIVLAAEGTDTDVGFQIKAKAAATVQFYSTLSAGAIVFQTGTAYQHSSTLSFANTAASRAYTFQDATGTLCQDNTGSGSITTAPPASSAASLSLGSAYQNTNGYDVVVTVFLSVTAATTASILSGIGPTNTPTQQTIVSGLTLAALNIIPVTLYIPAGYYALLSTSGTITATISGQQTMAV